MTDPLMTNMGEHIVQPKDVEMLEMLPVETPITSANSLIHKAAKDGAIDRLKALIEANASSLNSLDDKEMAPLHYASQCNQIYSIKTLLEAGADVNIRGGGNITPLHIAARHNSIDAIEVLLAHNANLSIQCATTGSTAFLVATRMGNIEVVKNLMLKSPKVVDDCDFQDLTALHWAALRGSYDICEFLVTHGANIQKRTIDGSTPLVYAAESKNEKILPLLVDEAGNQRLNVKELINGLDNDATTPLFAAILAGNKASVKFLLEKGASVNTAKINLATPLHMAATNGDDHIVKLLLEKGAQVDSKDAHGETPLHKATTMGSLTVIKILLDNDAKLEEKDVYGRTPLLCAISTGQAFAVKMLLNVGADVMTCDNDMRTGLHLCTIDQQFLILHMLIKGERKELYHKPDFQERIPLHYAACVEDMRFLTVLLEIGSNCSYKDLYRSTPLHLASEQGLPEHVEMILKAAPSTVHEQDVKGFTALHVAALNKRWEVCDTLLKYGAQVDATDSNSQTPLFQAALSGSLPVIELLLNHHANIDHRDDNGNTILHIAAACGNTAIIKAFLDKGALAALNFQEESCFDTAIANKSGAIVNTIIQHNRWGEFVHVDRGGCHIVAKLIDDFPEAVTLIMDKCIKRSSHKPDDPNLSLTFDFQLLDPGPDRVYEEKQSTTKNPMLQTKELGRKRFYGLKEMVKHQRQELLVHPLATRLRLMKWRKFGVHIYLLNFLLYVVFAGLLTHFVLNVRQTVKKRQTEAKTNRTTKGCSTFVSKEQEIIASIILVIVAFHLAKEIFQMFTQRLRYFTDLSNLYEICMYAFALVFVIPYAFREVRACTDPREVIWNFGIPALFMAYFNLILLTRTISFIGLYVTMFIEVFKTMLKVMVMVMLFVAAFSLVFFIIFREQDAFDEYWESLVKVMAMTVGELDYNTMLVDAEYTTSAAGNPLLPYPTISYIFMFLFILMMPIVLMNLLVGLAVGDIEAIQKHAHLTRISKHVEFLTDIEKRYPKFLTRMLYTPIFVVYPNQAKSYLQNWWMLFGKSMEKLMIVADSDENHPPNPEDEKFQDLKDELKEVKDKMKTLVQLIETQNIRIRSSLTSSRPSISDSRRSTAGEESSPL